MQFFKKYKKLRGLHTVQKIYKLLIKSIQYLKYSYKFIYRIYVYLSYIYRIFFIDYRICIVIYDIRYTIYDIFVYRIHYSSSNPNNGKIRFSQFTLFYRVECEKLFCKTNIKLKVLKLNNQNLFQNLDDIKYSIYVVFRVNQPFKVRNE